ncbi:MAG: adenylosuccinate synthase [Candidatus Bipolaricaulota bacterium]|nr:adenylosuccinate synthase [Candidatus Bipolaricaulota bacterium]MDW8126616.1 adenylosuccinate synthase [Candidatus Bipolaricaulota bacterium]
MAPALAIIGAQWGDEAKGKIVHFLSREADLCVRFNGGPNAGHTVVDEYGVAKLHQVPAGALHSHCLGVLSHGMVLDPWALEEELAFLQGQGRPAPKLLLSERTHLVLPSHRIKEEKEGASSRLGTTKRGVGPAYADRVARRGLRLLDLAHPHYVRERLRAEFDVVGGFDVDQVFSTLMNFYQKFHERIGDARVALSQALASGKTVIFEGAQGTMLDVDFGTYPYVTSSHTTVHGIPWGTGVWPEFSAIVGVVKAYTTRVGAGPLPTEERGPLGERLREAGEEYGATTGRPRRCGWLDLVALRYAHAINRFTHIALTKLDVLSGFPEIRVAVAYRIDGEKVEEFPACSWELERAEPIYETLPGWQKDIQGAKEFTRLPKEAQAYVRFLEEVLGVPVALIGTGPEANSLIVRGELS